MGSLGFVFDCREIEKGKICVLFEIKRIEGTIILGIEPSLKGEIEFKFLGKDLKFQKSAIDTSRVKYSKISVYSKTELDFDNLTAWFGVKKYKILRNLLFIDNNPKNLEAELLKRTNEIIELI